jgi:hypothetical protein
MSSIMKSSHPSTVRRGWKTTAIVLAVLLIVFILVLITVLGVAAADGRRIHKSFSYAASNNRACGRPGVQCELATSDDIGVPVLRDAKFSAAFSRHVARFCADLVARLSTHRNQQKALVPPPGLVQVAVLDAQPNDALGWVLVDSESAPTAAWIVFRGTSSKEEWEKDFELQQMPFVVNMAGVAGSRLGEIPVPKVSLHPGVAHAMFRSTTNNNEDVRLHEGFLDMYRAIRPQLIRALAPFLKLNLPIFVTGHSLGAAVAAICTLDLSQNAGARDVRTYTFAPPRVGNPAFARALSSTPGLSAMFQLVNTADVVPAIPLAVMPNASVPEDLLIYEHAGTLMYFTENWESWKNNHTMPIYIKNIGNAR